MGIEAVLVSAFSLAILFAPPAHSAVSFRIVDGDVTSTERMLCKRMQAAISILPAPIDMYGWPETIEFPGLSRPDWVPVDPLEHLDAIKKVYLAIFDAFGQRGEDYDAQTWRSLEPLIRELVRLKVMQVDRARVDLGSDSGGRVHVYRIARPIFGSDVFNREKWRKENFGSNYYILSETEEKDSSGAIIGGSIRSADLLLDDGRPVFVALPQGQLFTVNYYKLGDVPARHALCDFALNSENHAPP